jgi:hypothetical protein
MSDSSGDVWFPGIGRGREGHRVPELLWRHYREGRIFSLIEVCADRLNLSEEVKRMMIRPSDGSSPIPLYHAGVLLDFTGMVKKGMLINDERGIRPNDDRN